MAVTFLPGAVVPVDGGRSNFIPSGVSGTSGYTPDSVADTAARLALTGMVNGAVVAEIGAPSIVTITVNFDDVSGNTKGGGDSFIYISHAAVPFCIDYDGRHGCSVRLGYADNATSGQIASAIAHGINLSASSWATATVSGSVVTITSTACGIVYSDDTVVVTPVTGLYTLNVVTPGLAVGSTYKVIDATQLSSEAGWQIVDPPRNAVVPSDTFIQSPQGLVDYFTNGGWCSSLLTNTIANLPSTVTSFSGYLSAILPLMVVAGNAQGFAPTRRALLQTLILGGRPCRRTRRLTPV